MKLRHTLVCCLLLPISPNLFAAPSPASQTAADAARSFVATFYAWYVPKILGPNDGSTADIALARKRADFSPALAKALDDDAAASAKSPGEVVGLDFDPYLNSQDPCDHYAVRGVSQAGDSYKVEVFGSCSSDERKGKPDVVAVVTRQGKSWVFVDFIYPAEGDQAESDLLSILKDLKQDRDKPAK